MHQKLQLLDDKGSVAKTTVLIYYVILLCLLGATIFWSFTCGAKRNRAVANYFPLLTTILIGGQNCRSLQA